MRKFSIIGHYFITPGRYSCPGVSPARGGWPWNAGNAPVCGGAGEGRSLKVGSRGWFRRWFREWFRELVVAEMVSRPVPGGGCRMVPEWFRADAGEVPGGSFGGWFPGDGSRGMVPGGGFGGGYGHGGRPSDGDVRAGWFGASGSGPGKGGYGFFGREVCLNHTVCC